MQPADKGSTMAIADQTATLPQPGEPMGSQADVEEKGGR